MAKAKHAVDASNNIFVGNGEMAARCRDFDWASTPLGPVSGWSHCLRSTVSSLLAARNPMFLWWGEELVQFYNDAYRPSFGLGERDRHALGARGKEFWTDIWSTIGPQIDGVMKRGESVWFEDAYIPIERNGTLEDVWWTYSYSPVRDDDGTISGTLVICQETTGRVQAEQRLKELITAHLAARAEAEQAAYALADLQAQFQAVLDASPDASLVARAIRDGSGNITDFVFTYANAASKSLLLGRDEKIVGRTMREVFSESVAAGRLDRYAHVVETGNTWLADVQYTRGPVSHGLRVTAVKVGDGVHIGAIDLSERMRAAEERERLLAAAEGARRDAEGANRAKSDFLAVMSHELRTPLNAIDGYAELLELGVHGPITAQQQQDLDRIRKSQRHLLGLINGVLSYTRVEKGVARFDLDPVRLCDVLASCEALVIQQMNAKELVFGVEVCAPTLAVVADDEKLQQILLNLLTNALKFTARGGSVRVSCVAADANVAITVEDTGRGIPPDQIERVFEPFVQVDSGLTRTEHGVGLGLAISRDLARAMNGDISLVSVIGKGSVFTLTMPRAPGRSLA